ncbi:hypothetical protein [Paenibacillus silviterrae]|uniref:hypothetical protein n=1 Tax=Paenibacillus silviterrae TaxID=3242194 RepID=UPI0025428E7F|nr:hypothetical protein [Paenibacillus chinjuensis]
MRILKTKAYTITAYIIALLVVMFSYTRLYFGVDFTDEAFYNSIPFIFSLGQVPFVDEINLLQTASFFTYPFIKLYIIFMGSSDGLVLFTRHLYFFFMLLLSYFIYNLVVKSINKDVAILVSLPSVTFTPFNIPSLSYNTLGMGFLSIGLFLGVYTLQYVSNKKWMVLTGLSLGFAVVAYPTLIMPIIFYALLLLLHSIRKKVATPFLFFTVGGCLAVLPLLLIANIVGIKNILLSYQYSTSVGVQGGSFSKVIENIETVYTMFNNKWVLVFTMFALCISYKYVKNLFSMLLLIFPFLAFDYDNYQHIVASMVFIIYYALLAPFLLIYLRKDVLSKRLFLYGWVPSFIAGITTLWSSSNGYKSAAIGIFPGAIITSIYVILILTKLMQNNKSSNAALKGLLKGVQLLYPLFLLMLLIMQQFSSVYRDDKIPLLTRKVDFGPYKGIYSTDKKYDFMKNLTKDISRYPTDMKILFYDYFPAGYLFSTRIPAANTTWLISMKSYPKIKKSFNVSYYNDMATNPAIVVRMKKIPFTSVEALDLDYVPVDPINNKINKEFTKVAGNDSYEILIK